MDFRDKTEEQQCLVTEGGEEGCITGAHKKLILNVSSL